MAGKFIRWDETGRRIEQEIKRGEICVLPANSISFVQIEPQIRLPHYIALRFNLRLTHVHRGLLLGTGPLVDPGFAGKLPIPLHNLTAEPYTLDTTEALIWIEFTKTTYGFQPKEPEADVAGERKFKPFPDRKKDQSPEYYLHRANQGNPIQSSIPKSKLQADTALQVSEKTRKTVRSVRRFSYFAGFAVVVAGATLIFQGYSLLQDSWSLTNTVVERFSELDGDTRLNTSEIARIISELESAGGQLDATIERIQSLEKAIETLRENGNPTDTPQ